MRITRSEKCACGAEFSESVEDDTVAFGGGLWEEADKDMDEWRDTHLCTLSREAFPSVALGVEEEPPLDPSGVPNGIWWRDLTNPTKPFGPLSNPVYVKPDEKGCACPTMDCGQDCPGREASTPDPIPTAAFPFGPVCTSRIDVDGSGQVTFTCTCVPVDSPASEPQPEEADEKGNDSKWPACYDFAYSVQTGLPTCCPAHWTPAAVERNKLMNGRD